MKRTLIFLVVLLAGCYTVKQAAEDAAKRKQHKPTSKKYIHFKFDYKMIAPLVSDQMIYEDSVISAFFSIQEKEIDFTIRNKKNEPIKINWNNSSMAILGESNKIMHKGVKYTDRNSSMSPSVILPNTTLSDLALPSDNVYFNEGTTGQIISNPSSWEEKPLFVSYLIRKDLDTTLINSLKGQTITLYLPISDLNDKNFGYTFTFQVTNVTAE